MTRLTRVLVVDDSSFMRKSVTHILERDESIAVVGVASNGEEAIRGVKDLRPDVVLLDIEMPLMDGLAALGHIMAECPTPVLMLSGIGSATAAVALKSLDHGAVDFIAKPSGTISYDIDELGDELISKVKAAALVDLGTLTRGPPQPAVLHGVPHHRWPPWQGALVIGASTGGPGAVAAVLAGLPRDVPLAVLVVQHMGREFVPSFALRLQQRCLLEVAIARRNDAMNSGAVLVAPGGQHTVVVREDDSRRIAFSRKKPAVPAWPSIDLAMVSVAEAYGSDAIGVLLTGIGTDGAAGLKAIKDAGGRTLAEDRSSCVVFGMPKAAIELGCVDEVVPLPRMTQAIFSRAITPRPAEGAC